MTTALSRLRLSQTARPVDTLLFWDKEDQLDLSPPYQRGDVWGKKRQRNLIKSLLLGVPIPSLIMNDRFAAEWGETMSVIDGKQRITAILSFLNGQLDVPGEWFDLGQEPVLFHDLPMPQQRRFRHMPLQMSEGQLPSLEAEIELFELVNFGGLAQGESDF